MGGGGYGCALWGYSRREPRVTQSIPRDSRDQSEIKAKIVKDCFWARARVISASLNKYGHGEKIAYIDLFSGPGRYKDGTKSTPLLILEAASADPDISSLRNQRR